MLTTCNGKTKIATALSRREGNSENDFSLPSCTLPTTCTYERALQDEHRNLL